MRFKDLFLWNQNECPTLPKTTASGTQTFCLFLCLERVGEIMSRSSAKCKRGSPAAWETEMGKSWFKANLGKKLVRPHLNKQAKHGGVCLLLQLYGRCRKEDHSPRQASDKNIRS
jgi:hypothetical protein